MFVDDQGHLTPGWTQGEQRAVIILRYSIMTSLHYQVHNHSLFTCPHAIRVTTVVKTTSLIYSVQLEANGVSNTIALYIIKVNEASIIP